MLSTSCRVAARRCWFYTTFKDTNNTRSRGLWAPPWGIPNHSYTRPVSGFANCCRGVSQPRANNHALFSRILTERDTCDSRGVFDLDTRGSHSLSKSFQEENMEYLRKLVAR